MGIERDDKDKRQDWVLRGFRQFDAPVCVIVTYDRVLDGSDDTPFDCGAVTTALVNAAWSRGLGAVINSQGIMQSPVVREHAGNRRRSGHHEKHRAGLAGRNLSGECGGVGAQVGRGGDGVCRLRQLGARGREGRYRYDVGRNFFTYDRKLHRNSSVRYHGNRDRIRLSNVMEQILFWAAPLTANDGCTLRQFPWIRSRNCSHSRILLTISA